jgi:hypothetical protein
VLTLDVLTKRIFPFLNRSLDYALGVFIVQIKRRMPESKGRDGVLESSEQLLCYINESFAV